MHFSSDNQIQLDSHLRCPTYLNHSNIKDFVNIFTMYNTKGGGKQRSSCEIRVCSSFPEPSTSPCKPLQTPWSLWSSAWRGLHHDLIQPRTIYIFHTCSKLIDLTVLTRSGLWTCRWFGGIFPSLQRINMARKARSCLVFCCCYFSI